MINDLLNKATGMIAQIGQAISTYSPKVWQVYTAVVQANAVGNIITVGMLFLLGCGLFFSSKGKCDWERVNFFIAPTIVGGLTALTTFIILAADPWWFIAAINPNLGAAHEVINLILNLPTYNH